MKRTIRELESRIARLEKHSSKKTAMKIIHRELIEYLKKKNLKNVGKSEPLEYGGLSRKIGFEFTLTLNDNEYEEMTKFFNKSKKYNNEIVINDDAVDGIIEHHLDEDEYFAPSNARYAGGSPFCILSLYKNGLFTLTVEMTVHKKKTPKIPTPLQKINLGIGKTVFDIKRLTTDLWMLLKDQIAFKLESMGREEEELEDLANQYMMKVRLVMDADGFYSLRVKSGRNHYILDMEDTEKHEITNSRGRYTQKALERHLDLNYDDYTRWEVR